jgi:CSLREA domain-containing protein
MIMYELLRGSDAQLRGTNEAVMTRPAMHPLKVLAVVGAAFLVWGLLFAYASSPAQAATLTVNSLADGARANDGQCTLREAILNANADDRSGSTDCAAGSGSDAIRVGVTGTVQLSGALPNLSSNLQIVGPGADQFTVRRNTGGDYRIFIVTSDGSEPVVSISGITISNGNASQTLGGGILNFGTLTVTGSTISGNSAYRGGGISNHNNLTTTRSTISGNYADLDSGDTLAAVLVSGPSHADSFELDANGSFSYTPKAANYNGPDSFTYKPTGGTEDSNTATVSIEVNPVDDAPKIAVVAGSASQSACLSDTMGGITLKLSDADSDLGDLKPSVTGSSDTRLVPKSNIAFGGTGGARTATISTVAGRTGTSTVTITVSDGQGRSSVPVTVKAGGKGRDTLGGTSGADLLLCQNGDDTLSGAGGNDLLCGANGNDKLSGGTGFDTFDGGSGTDAATDYNATQGDSRTNIP